MSKLTCAIADDNERMRQLLEDVLNTDGEIEVVGKAGNGEEAQSNLLHLNKYFHKFAAKVVKLFGISVKQTLVLISARRKIRKLLHMEIYLRTINVQL